VQALHHSPIPFKIQIGESLTEGRGAGNNPDIGREAALESEENIKNILSDNTRMLFITAGMGGGTGTGAAPVIARISKEMGILTVGIVTIPFKFEGKVRINQAIKGIEELEKYVDSLLVVNNERLRQMYGDLKLSQAFSNADNVLTIAAKGIAEIITLHGYVNVDFADVKTVMTNSGVAIMGSSTASGENRALHAIKKALSSPLLNSSCITGAQNVLLNVTSGTDEFRLDELCEITDFVQGEVEDNVQIIWGHGIDERLGENVCVTIIATGFKKENVHDIFVEKKRLDSNEFHNLVDNHNVILEIIGRRKADEVDSEPEPLKAGELTVTQNHGNSHEEDARKQEILAELEKGKSESEVIQLQINEQLAGKRTEEIISKHSKKSSKKKLSQKEPVKVWIQTKIEEFFNS
jgi:cell division protein FtsZ